MMSGKKKEFTPKIVTFLCNWCGYDGANLGVISGFKCPPSIRIVRLICSGRIHPALILDVFNRGTDGVLVCGCHIGDCHYISGNEKAEERIKKTKKLLELLRIETERLRLEWVSSSEGAKFADILKDFTEQLISLGPFKIES